ncbi:MAG: ribosome silencing factor [Bacteroidales bacterium]|nr:ribosome silencing factor [Bacteroidales bacterium]
MAKSKPRNSTELLFDTIFDAMHDKKAENILLLDLTKIKGANFDYFIITHGNSTTQVNAIAEEVRRKVKTILHMNPAHAEGFTNSEWVLLDYLDVVVHIFQHEVREHYQLENLWADAVITPIVEEIPVKKPATKKEPVKKEAQPRASTKKPVKKSTKNNERKSAKPAKSTAKPATKSKSAKSATKKA